MKENEGAQWAISSSKNPRFQNEAKCTTFVVNMRFICMRIKNHFHINGFALSLALKQRLEATWKWPIKADLDGTIFAYDYRARLAYVTIATSRQIVSCKLDPRHSYDRLWMS